MSNINLLVFLRFLFIIISQILIFNNILIFGVSPNIYLIFLIIFPLNYNKSFMYLYMFIAGLILDLFSNTYGIITFSLLISSLLKIYFLKFHLVILMLVRSEKQQTTLEKLVYTKK